MDRTFALIKPEGMESDAYQKIVYAVADARLFICKSSCLKPSRDLVEEHYAEHKGKEYFDCLVGDIAEHKVVAMVLKGEDAVEKWRFTMGPFCEDERQNPEFAKTIRAQLMKPGDPLRRNFVHGSDSNESAEREIALWFPEP